jgi:type IV pilus assembly protein PilB
MNDNATAMSGSVRAVLSGLPQRLVLDGLIEEAAMLDAIASARERKTHLVSWLVSHDLAAARDIAIAAAQEFGVPLLDLDAINIDLDTVRLVNDKLMAKHRILPLVKRGKRLHVAVSDPTNLHAVDEIKFQTGLSIEAVIVEDDKLQRAVQKAIESVDTSMPSLGGEDDFDLENLDVSAAEDQMDADTGRDDIEDAPIVRFVNKIMLDAIRKNASDIHFEPYEKYYRIRLRVDGVLREVARDQARRAPESDVAARHRRAARAAGRPHQDAALEEPLDRLPRFELPDPVRREDRAAYPGRQHRDDGNRRAGL